MHQALGDELVTLLVARSNEAASGEPVVEWAVHALEAGLESAALIELAGLPRTASVFDAGPLLDRALRELGIAPPDLEELLRAYVGVISRALLEGKLAVAAVLDDVHATVVSPLRHPDDLRPWCYLWESLDPVELRSLEPYEVASKTRRLAEAWALYPGIHARATDA